jgi:hypothetical protein|nr:MAG TPA: Transcription Regulator [Crassvirales sp.]
MKISKSVIKNGDGYQATICLYNQTDPLEQPVYTHFVAETPKSAIVGARLKMLALFEKVQSRAINMRIEVGALLLKLNPNEYGEEEVTNG